MPNHVLGDRRLGDLKPEFQQFPVDTRGADAHPPDRHVLRRLLFRSQRRLEVENLFLWHQLTIAVEACPASVSIKQK